MSQRTTKQNRKAAKRAARRRKKAEEVRATASVIIERYRTCQVIFKYGCPVVYLIIFLIIILLILYGPKDRMETLNNFLEKSNIDNIFYFIIFILSIVIFIIRMFGKWIGSISPDDNIGE